MLWLCYTLQGAVNQSGYSRSNLICGNVGCECDIITRQAYRFVCSCHFVLSLRKHLIDPSNAQIFQPSAPTIALDPHSVHILRVLLPPPINGTRPSSLVTG